jgi:hypothetical protein
MYDAQSTIILENLMKSISIYRAFRLNYRISGTLMFLLEENCDFSYFSRAIKRYSNKFGHLLYRVLFLSPRAG